MKREMEPYQLIERSIIKKYRKELWTPFIVAVKRYELIKAGVHHEEDQLEGHIAVALQLLHELCHQHRVLAA